MYEGKSLGINSTNRMACTFFFFLSWIIIRLTLPFSFTVHVSSHLPWYENKLGV